MKYGGDVTFVMSLFIFLCYFAAEMVQCKLKIKWHIWDFSSLR